MVGDKDQPPPETPIKIEPNSPFFLGPQDRPGDYITPVKLRTYNFDTWAYSIRMALLSRRKYGFLEGTIKSPTPPCTKDDWLTIHSMLVSWIMNTIDPECDYNIGKSHEKRREDECLRQFLMGLCSKYYGQIHSTLLSQDPLPSLNRAFQQISQEERVREKYGNKRGGHSVLTARQGNTGTSSLSPNVGRGKGGVRALNVAADAVPSSREATILLGFTSDQWQALVAAFGNPQPPSNRLNVMRTEDEVELSNNIVVPVQHDTHETTPPLETASTSSFVPVDIDVTSDYHILSPMTEEAASPSVSTNSEHPNMGRGKACGGS
ncbi:hypothetical protein POM88_002490 [Heracleum sosnowskyi]|uniref:Retrotransposon Copia-like N-terminal domain-containing protein n=1 Tax=Heracleum sosnowskyi TaxID=360622 RepID=A0AAD8N5Z0_9APIA|nr:hypothetical protein POM88_002490 [Heracleum sosnowskyi]